MAQPTQAEMLQNMLSTLAQGQVDLQQVIAKQAETQTRLDANLQTALSQLGEAKDVIIQQQAELAALKAATTADPAEPSTRTFSASRAKTASEEENFKLPSSAVQRPSAWDGKAETGKTSEATLKTG